MAQTPDDFLDLLRRNTSPEFLNPLLDNVDSRAIINGLTAIAAAIDLAREEGCNTGLIGTAPGGAPGTSTVTISRTIGGTAGTIPKGYQFVDARGFEYVSQTDVPVGTGDLTVDVPVFSLRQIEIVRSVDDPVMVIGPANLVVLDVTLASALIAAPGDAAAVASTFQVVDSSTPVIGALSDYLSVHGNERSIFRQANEDTGAYRRRVRVIPDVVSPIAISNVVQGIAQRIFGLPPIFLEEPFDIGETQALRDEIFLREFETAYADDAFLDDPQSEIVSGRESRAYFRIAVDGLLFDPNNFSAYMDDAFFDDEINGFFDGSEFGDVASSILAAIIQEVEVKKAQGVLFDTIINGYDEIQGKGSTAAGGLTLVFTLTPTTGDWRLVEGFLGVSAPVPPSGGDYSYHLRFTFTDASTFDTPIRTVVDGGGGEGSDALYFFALVELGFPFAKDITKIEGFASADGTSTVLLVANLWVLEVL